jgi:hypothetical protein
MKKFLNKILFILCIFLTSIVLFYRYTQENFANNGLTGQFHSDYKKFIKNGNYPEVNSNASITKSQRVPLDKKTSVEASSASEFITNGDQLNINLYNKDKSIAFSNQIPTMVSSSSMPSSVSSPGYSPMPAPVIDPCIKLPSYQYASDFDNIINDDSLIVTGLQTDLYDARNMKRIVSKYVYPYIPENGDILLSNPDSKPWNRHPINSIPRNLITKYDNVFYYELENDLYIKTFNKTFHLPCSSVPYKYSSQNRWSRIIEADKSSRNIQDGYYAFIQYIQDTLNTSTNFILKEDPNYTKKIQIVHDIFKNYKTHNNEYYTYLLHIELLLYREGKYNGKHIGIRVVVSNNTYNPLKPKNIYGSSPSPMSSPGPSPGSGPSNSPMSSPGPSPGPGPSNSPMSSPGFAPSSSPISSPGPGPGPSPTTSKFRFIYDKSIPKISYKDWTFYIIESELIGDVPEDMILLFPVVPITEYDVEELSIEDSSNIEKKYAGILSYDSNGNILKNNSNITTDKDKNYFKNYMNIEKKNNDIIKYYSSISPTQAGIKLLNLDLNEQKNILSILPSRNLVEIFSKMDIDKVRLLTDNMTKKKALEVIYLITHPTSSS